MIKSREDLHLYLAQDKKTLGIPANQKRPHLFGNELWKYLIVLRNYEYYANCHRNRADRYKLLFLVYYITICRFGPVSKSRSTLLAMA